MKIDYLTGTRVYDDGGKSIDRYTIVFISEPEGITGAARVRGPFYMSLGLSAEPDHPQGVSQYGAAKAGRHLGNRISFDDLPPNVQRHVLLRMAESIVV